mmetsp:Transcript_3089/g.4683  ORF Transcript_3089/g.4683 Transcript_3089/m.4683 type:complete len:202 (+) Transcript_3089:221-826(+)
MSCIGTIYYFHGIPWYTHYGLARFLIILSVALPNFDRVGIKNGTLWLLLFATLVVATFFFFFGGMVRRFYFRYFLDPTFLGLGLILVTTTVPTFPLINTFLFINYLHGIVIDPTQRHKIGRKGFLLEAVVLDRGQRVDDIISCFDVIQILFFYGGGGKILYVLVPRFLPRGTIIQKNFISLFNVSQCDKFHHQTGVIVMGR